MNRSLTVLIQALIVAFTVALVYRLSQNQATRAWNSGQATGYQDA